MTVAVSTRTMRAAKVVHIGSLVILGLAALAEVVGQLTGRRGDLSPFFAFLAVVVLAGYSTLGRLIVIRAGNLIGWLFLAIGTIEAIEIPAEGYVQASSREPYLASLPGTAYAGWIANLAPGLVALTLPMFFLLYPTGTLPSHRWRWVARLWASGAAVSLVWLAFRPGAIYGDEPNGFRIRNPLGIGFLEPLQPLFLTAGTALALTAAVLGIASLVVRFRRAHEQERGQILWLMLVGIAAAIVFLSMMAINLLGMEIDQRVTDKLWIALVLVLLVGIPAATTLAIFRYRLYETGLVVSKTIVYGALAAFIGLVYVGGVVGIGALVNDRQSPVLRIAATAVVAVAFQPVRHRLQRFANRLVYGARATPYEVMAGFGHRIAGVPSTDQVLHDMAEAAGRGVGASHATVRVFLADGRERGSSWPDHRGQDGSAFELPIEHAGEPVGVLEIVKPPNDPLRPAERALLDDLVGHAGLALRNVRISAELQTKADELAEQTEELQRSKERLVSARDAERRQLERELRAGVGADIAAIRDEIAADADRVRSEPEAVARSLESLGERTGVALGELRDLARGIFPPLLADRGIAPAIEAYVRKLGIPARLHVDPALSDTRLDPSVENALYFCAVQALQEARLRGSSIRVHLEPDGSDAVRFEVSNDGQGFDASTTTDDEGTQVMRDRIAAVGGELAIENVPGRGTTVRGRVPTRTLEVSSR